MLFHFIGLICLCSRHILKGDHFWPPRIIRTFSFYIFFHSVRTCLQEDDMILDLHFSILGNITEFFSGLIIITWLPV